MRRLFSNFANGAPGVGLLLLRVSAAAALIAPAVHMAEGAASGVGVVGSVLAAANGLLLGIGLWTPVAGAIGALLALWHAASPAASANGLMLAAVSAALALLGPGAWSIDARLFGWKRIEIAPRKGDGPTSD